MSQVLTTLAHAQSVIENIDDMNIRPRHKNEIKMSLEKLVDKPFNNLEGEQKKCALLAFDVSYGLMASIDKLDVNQQLDLKLYVDNLLK